MVRPIAGVLLTVAVVAGGGCAGSPGWRYADTAGVPVSVDLAGGGILSGTLTGYAAGAFEVDHAIPKSPTTEVVRRDGRDIVYVRGVPVGIAVEVRDFDIVVRQRLQRWDIDGMRVGVRRYFGWGTGIAGVLAFFLVQILEDL